MRAVVVYESMYGNTHQVAEAIGDGLRTALDVSVVAVGRVNPALLDGADLVVVGGPTHMHAMSRASSRKAAWRPPTNRPARSPPSRGRSAPGCGNGSTRWAATRPGRQRRSTRSCTGRAR